MLLTAKICHQKDFSQNGEVLNLQQDHHLIFHLYIKIVPMMMIRKLSFHFSGRYGLHSIDIIEKRFQGNMVLR